MCADDMVLLATRPGRPGKPAASRPRPHSSPLWTAPGVFGTHQNYPRCPSALATDEAKDANIKDGVSLLLHPVEGCSGGGTSGADAPASALAWALIVAE